MRARWLVGVVVVGFGGMIFMQQRAMDRQAAALAELSAKIEATKPAAPNITVVSPTPTARAEVARTAESPRPSDPAATPKATTKEEPARTYEQERALDAAKQRLANFLQVGHASQRELMALQDDLVTAGSASEAYELKRQLAAEINLGRVTLELPSAN